MSARVARIAGDKLCLSFTPQNRFAREMVLEEKNRRFIEYHIERFFGRKLFIEADEQCEAVSGGAAPSSTEAPKRRVASSPELETIAGDAPVISRLIKDFDAEPFKEKG
jgi:hypothetical protein